LHGRVPSLFTRQPRIMQILARRLLQTASSECHALSMNNPCLWKDKRPGFPHRCYRQSMNANFANKTPPNHKLAKRQVQTEHNVPPSKETLYSGRCSCCSSAGFCVFPHGQKVTFKQDVKRTTSVIRLVVLNKWICEDWQVEWHKNFPIYIFICFILEMKNLFFFITDLSN
jgi:hypothetical protein